MASQDKNKNGFAAIEMLLVLLTLAIVAVAGYIVSKNIDTKNQPPAPTNNTTTSTNSKSAPKATAQTAITAFLTAMASQNKTAADALESPAFQQFAKSEWGTTSFYSACQSVGTLCTYEFLPANLSKATQATNSYTAKDDTKGVQDVISVKTATSSGPATTSSSYSFKIDAVPSGSTWLIDLVDQSGTTSFNATVN